MKARMKAPFRGPTMTRPILRTSISRNAADKIVVHIYIYV